MDFPEGLKYSMDHEWVKIEGNEATIGITDFAQGELGEIVSVDVLKVGEALSQNSMFGTVQAVKTTTDMFSPRLLAKSR